MRSETYLCAAVSGLTAACGLALEIVAGRMLAPHVGMSLHTWTAVIAVMLAGFSIGHWIGGFIADYSPPRAERALVWILSLASCATLLSLVLLQTLPDRLSDLDWHPVATIVLLAMALFFLPSLLVAAPSPILMKLAIDGEPATPGRIIGLLYAASAVGSIIGTLAAGYVLISYLGIVRTIFTLAFVQIALASMFFARQRRHIRRGTTFLFVVPLMVTGAYASFGQKLPVLHSACLKETPYHCIRVIDISESVGVEARSIFLDRLAHGSNVRMEPGVFLLPYLALMDRLAKIHVGLNSNSSVFIAGGGAYTLPRAWLTGNPSMRLTVAEIDPAVTSTAQEYLWADNLDRADIRHGDARAILRQERRFTYDIIVGDAFQDIAVPQHLVTQEFFAFVRTRLASDGIALMNFIDRSELPRLVLSVQRTLKTVFPVVEIWIDEDQMSAGSHANFVLLAAQRPTPFAQIDDTDVPGWTWRRWTDGDIAAIDNGRATVNLTDDHAPVDRLLSQRR